VGRTIAEKYRIEALAGMGGMGAVYSAWHLTIGRRVAVKILQPNVALVDARIVSLFEREARTVGRLVHDNICDILDAGRTADGIASSVMEWLDGRTLEEELANHRTLGLDATAELLRQIASALDAAHAADIIHRDLKPSNVVLQPRPDGRVQVKVVDFGIAKAVAELTVSHASLILGTPAYASPEHMDPTAASTRVPTSTRSASHLPRADRRTSVRRGLARGVDPARGDGCAEIDREEPPRPSRCGRRRRPCSRTIPMRGRRPRCSRARSSTPRASSRCPPPTIRRRHVPSRSRRWVRGATCGDGRPAYSRSLGCPVPRECDSVFHTAWCDGMDGERLQLSRECYAEAIVP
jgi:serine/threonine protein kinase